MARATVLRMIDDALAEERWAAARTLLQRELKSDPDHHWLRTQLGVTLYEQGRYAESLLQFQRSLKSVPDCPLTRWNRAGALDMLGRPRDAVRDYLWILNHHNAVSDDPCWESAEWAASLRADCLYRLGHCYRNLKQTTKAMRCFRKYLDLLTIGVRGTYTADDVAKTLVELTGKPSPRLMQRRVQAIINSAISLPA